MASFIVRAKDGFRIAIHNENHSGVFRLPGGLPEIEGRLKYLSLPDEAEQIGSADDALQYYHVAFSQVESNPENIRRARERHSSMYDDGYGVSEEWYWLGRTIDGEEVPCRSSVHVSGY